MDLTGNNGETILTTLMEYMIEENVTPVSTLLTPIGDNGESILAILN